MEFKVGDIVKVAEWVGVVTDILNSDTNGTFLRIQSPRNIYRRMVGEFIEVGLNPSLIRKATKEELQAEIEAYKARMDREMSALAAVAR